MSSVFEMFGGIKCLSRLVNREGDARELARDDDDGLSAGQAASLQPDIEGLEQCRAYGCHCAVEEQTAQQCVAVFGQISCAAALARIIRTRVETGIGNESA